MKTENDLNVQIVLRKPFWTSSDWWQIKDKKKLFGLKKNVWTGLIIPDIPDQKSSPIPEKPYKDEGSSDSRLKFVPIPEMPD